MSIKFCGGLIGFPDWVAIFDDEYCFDEWIGYEADGLEEDCSGTPFERVALTEVEARALVGDRLDDPTCWEDDEYTEGMHWCPAADALPARDRVLGDNYGDVFKALKMKLA